MQPQLIDKAFGNRLRDIRLTNGLTQTDLAQHCNISFQQIQKYEAGVNRVSISRLYQLADVLGVNPADLVRGLD